MWEWLIFGLVALVFAVVAAWVTGRVLNAPIAWVRGIAVGVVVLVICLPGVQWVFSAGDVIVDGRPAVSGPVGGLFLALIFGWVLALVVAVLVTLELLWPSHPWNPYRAAKGVFARRARDRRYTQIVRLLARRGLAFRQARRRGEDPPLPQEVAAALGEAGVTFVKLGQVLSTRDDVLPQDLTAALATLQMDVSPLPWSEARAVIERELKQPLADAFAEVDEVPLAAASVAQVHTARLLDGSQVVIKVQRPSARQQVTVDLDILQRLAADAEARTDWGRRYGTRALAAEFARSLREELDYRIEASNTELMRGTLAKSETSLRVPRVFEEFSTPRMLVQERVTGTPFSRLDGSAIVGSPDAERIADSIVDSVFEQIAVRGVFHADLHPGNLVLGDDGDVWLIDFGAVGILEKSLRRLLVALLLAVVNEDDAAATDALLLIVESSQDLDTAALQHDLGVVLTRVHNATLDASLFSLLLEVLRRHRLTLPPALLLVFRTLGSLEGTLRRLSPDYRFVERGLERVPHMARMMTGPKDALLTLETYAATVGEGLRRLPRRIEEISDGLVRGTLSVRVRAFDSRGERSWVEGLTGQLTTTIVGVVLVVSSVVLVVFGQGPLLTDTVPLLPFLGAAIGLGGFLLVLRSLRTGLMRDQRR